MKRPLLNFARALLLLVVGALVVFSGLYGPDFSSRDNYDFGSEWDCRGQPPRKFGNLNCNTNPSHQQP
jgi:hypothetical protein